MSKVILIDKSDLFGNTSNKPMPPITPMGNNLRKKDIRLIAELLGIEYPPKKKENNKKPEVGFYQQAVLLSLISYFMGLGMLITVHALSR